MRTAAIGGRQVSVTTEGTTVRGLFGGFEIDPDTGRLRRRAESELVRIASGSRRIRAARVPRLMPEEIYRLAGSRDEAVDLLRRHGYLRQAVRPQAPVSRPTPPVAPPTPIPSPATTATTATTAARGIARPEAVHVTGALHEPVVEELRRQSSLVPTAEKRLLGVESGSVEFDGDHRNSLAFYRWQGEGRYRVFMHPDWSDAGRGRVEALTRRAVDSGFWTPTGAPVPVQTVFAHEFGHHVTRAMFSESGIIDPADGRRLLEAIRDQLGVPIDVTHSPHSPISTIGTLMPRLTAAVENHPAVALNVSQYAMASGWELLAEVWQEYSTMGVRARPHIRTIGGVMQELAEKASSQ